MIKLFVHTWLAQRHRLSTLKSSSHRAPLPLFVSEMISWTHPRSSELKPELSLTHPYSPSALSLKIPLIPPFLHLSSPSPQHHSPSRPPSPLTYIIASRPTGIPSGPECSQEAGQVLSLPVRCLYKPLLLSGLCSTPHMLPRGLAATCLCLHHLPFHSQAAGQPLGVPVCVRLSQVPCLQYSLPTSVRFYPYSNCAWNSRDSIPIPCAPTPSRTALGDAQEASDE